MMTEGLAPGIGREENCWYYESPLGHMIMTGRGDALTGLWFYENDLFPSALTENSRELLTPVLKETVEWLDAYFGRKVPDHTPKVSFEYTLQYAKTTDPKRPGTKRIEPSPFRRRVWEILTEIPYGQIITYGEIARRISRERNGSKMSAQAAGGAVGHNPISIIVPCHRVTGAGGALTGYGAGIDRKAKLLELEGVRP